MESLKQLKETSEKRIAKVIDELNSLNTVFGNKEVEDALFILRHIRSDFQIDLDYLNSKSDEVIEDIKNEFIKEYTNHWTIKEICNYFINKLN